MRRARLNALWMFLLFVVVSQAVEARLQIGLAASLVIDTHDHSWRPSIFIYWETASFLACIATTLLVGRLQHRRLREYGYATDGALRQVLWGSFWGLVAPTALVGMIAALGGFSFGTLAMGGQKLAIYTIGWLVAFFGVGIAEETTFRATAQITLGEAIGPWPASIMISTIFAALHYFANPDEYFSDTFFFCLICQC